MFDRFFNGDGMDLNWEYIESVPEFAKLKECEQSKKWHMEGNVWTHTVKCVEAAYHLMAKYSMKMPLKLADSRAAVIAVLFHDIGKGVTTEFIKGDWHSYGHEFAGEKIARRILWDEPIYYREAICNIVRYHMEPLRIVDSKNLFERLTILSRNYAFEWRGVLFAKKCDILGSIPSDESMAAADMEKVDFLLKATKKMDIFSYGFGMDPNSDERYSAKISEILEDGKITWDGSHRQTAYMLIGLPGAGKNTYIEKNFPNDIKTLSRDDIRVELGYAKDGEKVVLPAGKENEVTDVFNRRMAEYAESGEDFVINNLNIKKKYRDGYRKFLDEHKIRTVYIYVEAPSISENIQRRSMFDPQVIMDMREILDWPHENETKCLTVIK